MGSSTKKERRRSRAGTKSPHEAARRGSLEERAAYVDSRRAADASPAAERRRRVAAELAGRSPLRIDSEVGFTRAEPFSLPGTEAVIDAAVELTDRVGHEALLQIGKKPMAKGFLPDSDLTRESAYMEFALGDEVLATVTDYLGVLPILTYVDVWYSAYLDRPTWSSQLFHLDHADISQVKLFLHCGDVSPASGPLTVLDATDSSRLAERVDYRFEQVRVADEAVHEAIAPDRQTVLDGPRGTAHFVDTSRCFHFGSRVQAGAAPRKLVVFQYLTPYAFEFQSDHRLEAAYRGLAAAASSERDRLVLGAD